MKLKTSSIRVRLTLWYTAVLILILCIVSLGVYLFMRNRLTDVARGELDSGLETVVEILRNSEGDIMDVYHLGQEPLFRVTRDGQQVYQTAAWRDAPWSASFAAENPVSLDIWETGDGRLFHFEHGSAPEYGFEITYALDVTSSRGSIRTLALILLAGIPFALVLALAGGYFLAGRALSPVKSITRKAREITAERLSDRLPVPCSHDEIGELAKAFNDTLARLEDSFDRLRRFTADASHELRTPLTSIRSVGEVALQGNPDVETAKEAIGSMLEETQRLAQLSDDLLTLARGDSGGGAPDRRPLDISGLVREVADELQILAEEKGQALTTVLPPSLVATVDKATLRQAVANVLHNAITYSPRGGRVEIRTGKIGDGRITIEILDDGPGIPESERLKVFERFYRLDKARSREEGGYGLGLAIARRAVEINGGDIGFIDKDGPGSHCRISLPAL